jgi:hypothetical protein
VIGLPVDMLTADDGTQYPGIRHPLSSSKTVSYVLTYDDVNTIQFQHPLECIAQQLWGNARYWFTIADLNPLREPSSWQVGETILLPTENPMTLIRNQA